jgi:hypothetical protein
VLAEAKVRLKSIESDGQAVHIKRLEKKADWNFGGDGVDHTSYDRHA